MAGLTTEEKQALQLFKEKLQEQFSDRLDSLQLFGSKARGDAQKHSDVDVLVVLNNATWQDRRRVSTLASRVLLETGVVISSKTFSPQDIETMRQRQSAFWQSVADDLIAL